MEKELLAMKRAIACIGGTVSQLCKECVDADYIRKNVDDSIEEMWFAKSEDPSRVSVDKKRLEEVILKLHSGNTSYPGSHHSNPNLVVNSILTYLTGQDGG